MPSRVFGAKGPAKPHLLQQTGGIAAEVADLRADVEATFVQIEADAAGTTAERTDGDFQDSLPAGYTFWDTTLKQLFVWSLADTTWYSASKGGTVSNTTANNQSGTTGITADNAAHDHGGATGSSTTPATADQAAHDHGGATGASTLWTLVSLAGSSLKAPGETYHAQDAGGGALNLAGGFSTFLPSRSLVITRSNAGPLSVDYVVTWQLPGGGTYDETITVPINGSNESVVVGTRISAITTAVDPVSTSDFTTGTGFSIGGPFTAMGSMLSVDGVAEAMVSYEAATGTVFPTTAPNGTKSFTVYAQMHSHTHSVASATPVITVTDAGHTHTIAGATPVITVTDPGHDHTQDAHTHTIT